MKGILTNITSGAEIDLVGASLVGRATESNVLITDPRASRRHAMIRRQDDGFWLFDLGSFNGSYVNGARVTGARQLADGDILNFADNEFRYNQDGVTQEAYDDDVGGSTIALIHSKPVIILVSDITGFTALSEQLAPDNLAQVIGSWYGDCETVLGSRGATVDKFIGDCVLAYWTEVSEANYINAVLSARDLLTSCHKIYEAHRDVFESVDQKFGAGVALHSGQVAYGGMSQGEFTLVGDPVNLTFRVEGLTRKFPHDVLVTNEFIDAAPGLKAHSECLGSHSVKGRVEPVEVWGFNSYPDS